MSIWISFKNLIITSRFSIFFKIILVLEFFLFLLLFYNQSRSNGYFYSSDWSSHLYFSLNSQNNKEAYSLMHQTIKIITNLFYKIPNDSVYIIGNWVMIILITSSLMLSVLIINFWLRYEYPQISTVKADLLSLSLLIVSMIIVNPGILSTHYLGIGSPNPWHNPTFIFSKPIAIVLFLITIHAFKKSLTKSNFKKEIILIVVLSPISMWAKPSFLISFIPTVFIFASYFFLKKYINFKFTFAICLSFVFAIFPLFWIYFKVYNDVNSNSNVVIAFAKVWSLYTDNIFKSILLGVCFPAFVFLWKRRTLNIFSWFAIVNYIISLLITILLSEEGERFYHGNFFWTYMFSLFFLFLTASIEFFYFTNKTRNIKIIGNSLFLLHLISGIYYFIIISLGFSYI